MKFRFYNLGTIKETELDLKPLTVIIGPNNSSKTYLAYSVYGLMKELREVFENKEAVKKIERLFEIISETTFSLKLDGTLLKTLIEIFKDSVTTFKKKLNTFFLDSSEKLFSKTKYELDIDEQIIKDSIDRLPSIFKVLEHRFSCSKRGDTLFFELQVRDVLKNRSQSQELMPVKQAISHIGKIIVLDSHYWPSPYLLPAERNSLILTYKHLAHSRLRNFKKISRGEYVKQLFLSSTEMIKSDIRYPEPIEDFLDSLLEIGVNSTESITNISQIANEIEKYLQDDQKIEISSSNSKLTEEIKLRIKEDLIIDLHNASSSIKQLTPLLIYLRYIASSESLLIIDEPEINLHPENQAKLLEILGMMVNAGIQVLITTHSPYFMAHLNNLVIGKSEDAAVLEKQAQYLYLQNPKAFLSMDQVSAYEMRDNKLVSLKDPDYGIRWDTLSDVSADIQQKFFQIFEEGKIHKNAKPRKKSSKHTKGEKG